MPNRPMAMAAPTGIQTVLSEMPDLFHICRQGNAIRPQWPDVHREGMP